MNQKPIHILEYMLDKQQFIESQYPKMCGRQYEPSIFPSVPRIVIFGDIHGDYKLAIDMMRIARLVVVQQNGSVQWIAGSTYVVQVGDQIDRCRPISNMICSNRATTYQDEASDIKIMHLFNDLHLQATKVGGAVISLLGNHELMNSMGRLSYVSYMGLQEFNNYKDPLNPTIKFTSGKEAREYAFAPGNEHARMMGCTRYPAVIVGSHLFVHAGLVDALIQEIGLKGLQDIETINIAIRMWLLKLLDVRYVDPIINYSKFSNNSIFWTRILGNIPPGVEYNNPVCMRHIEQVLKMFNVGSIIVGHTPQSFSYTDDLNHTCSGKVWRVDNGSSSAFHRFDDEFKKTGKVQHSRRPQVLEIINDKQYFMLDEHGRHEIKVQ